MATPRPKTFVAAGDFVHEGISHTTGAEVPYHEQLHAWGLIVSTTEAARAAKEADPDGR